MTRVVCEAGHKLVEVEVDGQDLPDGCPLCPECARRWLIVRVKEVEGLQRQWEQTLNGRMITDSFDSDDVYIRFIAGYFDDESDVLGLFEKWLGLQYHPKGMHVSLAKGRILIECAQLLRDEVDDCFDCDEKCSVRRLRGV
jgi:hypothetical protein